MATATQWEDSLSYRTDEEVMAIENALKTLSKWELFEKEFEGIINLRTIVSYESTQRLFKDIKIINP